MCGNGNVHVILERGPIMTQQHIDSFVVVNLSFIRIIKNKNTCLAPWLSIINSFSFISFLAYQGLLKLAKNETHNLRPSIQSSSFLYQIQSTCFSSPYLIAHTTINPKHTCCSIGPSRVDKMEVRVFHLAFCFISTLKKSM